MDNTARLSSAIVRTQEEIDPHHAAPRDVVRVIAFMKDRLREPLSLHDLAAASGVPARTLSVHFRSFSGLSPVAFHRRLRLDAVRATLRAGDSAADVTACAAQYGFTHFGRFAAQYRQAFGRLPSSDLKARRLAPPVVPPPARERVRLIVLPLAATSAHGLMFADGLAEGLAVALARTGWLDPMTPDMRDRDRARYAIRGRVQSEADRLRVTIRLLDIAANRHLWGDVFEQPVSHMLVLQDQIVESIVGLLPSCIGEAEVGRSWHKPPEAVTVCDHLARAFRAAKILSGSANAEAFDHLDRVRIQEPDNALANALAAWCHAQRAIYNFGDTPDRDRTEVARLVPLALGLDADDPVVLTILGTASTNIGALDMAETLIEKSLAIDPYAPRSWQRRGWLRTYRGDNTAALRDFRCAIALNPQDSEIFQSYVGIGSALFGVGRYAEAATFTARAIHEKPMAVWVYRVLAGALAMSGERDRARQCVCLLKTHYEDLSIRRVIDSLPMQPDFLARFADGLERAGLPAS